MIEKVLNTLGFILVVGFSLLVGLTFFDVPLPSGVWVSVLVLVTAHFIAFSLHQRLLLYVFKRIVEAVFVLLVIASLTFLLLRIVPGGPFDQEKALPAEVMANIEAKYQLDRPIYEQFFSYIGGLLRGDLGESYKYLGRNVTDIVLDTFPISFKLGIFALILAYLIGIPLGVLAAAHHNSKWDVIAMLAAISGVALPSFLVAPILILIFAIYLHWLPAALWNGPSYYILPVITLGVRPAAIIARLTRASVLDVIGSDYIRTARAKGLGQGVVLFKHVLKNSLIPVLTFSGPLVAGVLSGSFIIEVIFAVPGMGKHLISSVTNRDYPLILGVTLVFSALLVLANLIVDLLYSYFDPRIQLTK
ncbi:MAG: ABC transporter permease [Bdellovibrionales bacterium]|nr:ABC transporter permease [Bdellovibrionales bacterium]